MWRAISRSRTCIPSHLLSEWLKIFISWFMIFFLANNHSPRIINIINKSDYVKLWDLLFMMILTVQFTTVQCLADTKKRLIKENDLTYNVIKISRFYEALLLPSFYTIYNTVALVDLLAFFFIWPFWQYIVTAGLFRNQFFPQLECCIVFIPVWLRALKYEWKCPSVWDLKHLIPHPLNIDSVTVSVYLCELFSS